MTSTRTVNVAKRMDEFDAAAAELKQRLERLIAAGNAVAWPVYAALYVEDTPAMQCGSAPRLREVR